MRWASWAICLIILSLSPALAQEPAFPERGRSAVVDAAGVIPDQAEAVLAARLAEWNRSTGHELVVATVPSLQGMEIEDYGVRLLRHWRVGRAGANDGVILLVAPNERRIRIEVGYGLEGELTDALTSNIYRQTIRPALRNGDVGGALTAGAERIMLAAAPDAEELSQTAPPEDSGSISWWWIILGAPGFALLGLFLYPVVETWFFIWPFYVLMPAKAKRAQQRHDAKMAEADRKWRARLGAAAARANRNPALAHGRSNNLSTVGVMAERMREKYRKKLAREASRNPPRKLPRQRSGGAVILGALGATVMALDLLSSAGGRGRGGSGGGGGAGGGY